eukprot:scaffold221219_cov52-Attheya_sp.AAC.2
MQGHDTGELGTRTKQQGTRGMGPELLGAGNGRQAPITKKRGPSALFNMGYRHGVNGDGKEPRSVPVLRLTYYFAALVNLSST